MAHWYRLGVAVGITALVGCGNPTPDGPVSGHTTGSADAVVSPPVGDAPRAGLAVHKLARQAPTQTSPLEPTALQASILGARIMDVSRAISSAHDADETQREARQQWLAELRAQPDATVRLQALELWAQQPGEEIEPVLEALGDEDEAVQARAESLWEQALTQAEATPQAESEDGPSGSTTQ